MISFAGLNPSCSLANSCDRSAACNCGPAAVEDLLGGEYHSVFKGAGIAFEEVREYQPGDDIRTIDWNVTARMGHPFIKRFVEERELTVMLAVDGSGSQAFGTGFHQKRQVAAELAAVLAFSAITNNDRVGLLHFTDQVESFVPPRKGVRMSCGSFAKCCFSSRSPRELALARHYELSIECCTAGPSCF